MCPAAPDLKQFVVGIRNPAFGADQGYATAFFGQSRGRLGLYTAAHNLAQKPVDGKAFIRIENASWAVPAIEVYPARDASAKRVLRLSPDADAVEGESAAVVATSPAPLAGHIWDVARLASEFVDELLAATQGHVAVVDLDDYREPSPGALLRCVGYPPASTTEDLGNWARASATPYQGRLIRTAGSHLQAEFRPDAGLSGGPVFTEENCFAGVLVGKDLALDLASRYHHMLARIVPAAVCVGLQLRRP